MKTFTKLIGVLLALAMLLSMVPATVVGAVEAETEPNESNLAVVLTDEEEPDMDCAEHQISTFEAKNPTYTGVGWYAYERCLRCGYTTYVELPKLEEAHITTYEELILNLTMLEMITAEYVRTNPGKDPVALIIKFIRTGVERYNSGSWGIMAGYEDEDFAKYVFEIEDAINSQFTSADEMIKISGLKNLDNIVLPSGDLADVGHMFGTMDITWHNKTSQNHADVAGWAGDLVDLLEFSDTMGVSGTLEEMTAIIRENYLLTTPPEGTSIPGFNQLDMIGDMDALYLMQKLIANGYDFSTDSEELTGLAGMLAAYFTEDLSMEQRADYYLKNRLDGVSSRNAIREAVYLAYTSNKLISTLEATREFQTDNITELRKAVCYAFADYMCELAGDYVEAPEESYFTVFSSETVQLAPGIVQDIKLATSADNKQMAYYLVTADVTRDDVDVFANYNANDPSLGWAMSTVLDQANAAQDRHSDPETEHYVPNYNVIAGTNGAGFDMGTGEPGGLLVMEGKEYHGINANGFFGILMDGTPVIGTTEEYNTIYKGQVRDGIAGFGATLVKDGKIVASNNSTRASRTAVGITKTGKVVLMVLDGRQEPWSCGGDYGEIAQIMLEAGCVHAINLDGGGSTTYVAKQPGAEALDVVNRPSDGVQRSVSTSLIVVSTAPSSTAFDHAVLDAEADYLTVNTSIQLTAKGVSATGNVAELPEGAQWVVSNTRWGTITQDGLFTAKRLGAVDVQLVLDGQILGSKTMHIVDPDNVYFTKTSIDTVYGATVELPVRALFEGKTVAVNADDLIFSLSNAKAGTFDGFNFISTSNENSGIKNVNVIVGLAVDEAVQAAVTVNLYKQGEMSFDFDQATGGDRTLAWYREVINAETEDGNLYRVVDPEEDIVTNYTLAIDMTKIPIPERLEDLTYMLPGADLADASAWKFLMQLAQRISSLTEITASVQFDEDFEIDISNMKLVNQFFKLTDVVVDEETNTVTMTLNWIKQSQAIDPETASPLCIVSGIKLTPKEDANWSSKNLLEAVHTGNISYKVCMRASALYSFSQKPENQATFGLYAYSNPDDAEDKGGYFQDTYATFTDSYTLVNAVKSGWILEDGGYAYYADGQKYTGIQNVDGYYYDFGENGINVGQTKYTGLMTMSDKIYYASFGTLVSGWQTVGTNYYYFGTSDYAAYTGVRNVGGKTYTFDDNGVLVRGAFVKTSRGVRYYWAGQTLVSRWIELEEGIYRADQNGFICYGNNPVIEAGREACTWWAFDEETGLRIGICDGFIQKDGELYYCENGAVFYGAIQTENGIIFCGTNGKVYVNTACYVSSSLETTAGLETGYYWADANGYIVKDGFATIGGKTYYFTDYVRATGFTKIGENYYFFNTGNGVMIRDSIVWVSGNNPYGIKSDYYTFQADGTMYIPDPNGPKAIVEKDGKLYFTVDGVEQTNGLNELDGEYYYANLNGTLAVNTVVYISKFNDLIAPGAGYFAFDAEGKLIKNGFVTAPNGNVYHYADLVRSKGFTKVGEDYYFFNAGSGVMQYSKTLWVAGSNPYGVKSGYYTFQADGTMYIPNPNGPKAIVEKDGKLYFTIDGVDQTNGLNELDGEYYYANLNGTLAVNTVVYISKFNDLIAPGSGYFAFDAEGKLIKDGFVTAPNGNVYHYAELVRSKGFTKVGEDYYFFNTGSGVMQCSKTLWVAGSNPYGIESGYYTFQEDGTMYIPNPNGPKAIVEKDGKLYFTIDGVDQTNGLNELDGEYYYAYTNGTLAVNTVVYISKFNDLIAPGAGYFAFDAEGKLIKDGFVTAPNGDTYHYVDLVRSKGFTKVGEDYYFFNTGSGVMQCDKSMWVAGSNPYGFKSGTYYFGADGKLVIEE